MAAHSDVHRCVHNYTTYTFEKKKKYIYIYNIYIYATPPPKDLLVFFCIFAFADSIGRLAPWRREKENRSFCKYSSQIILQGKVCQRLDL